MHQLGEDWKRKRSSDCVYVCLCDDGAAATKEREEETHLLLVCVVVVWTLCLSSYVIGGGREGGMSVYVCLIMCLYKCDWF